MKCSKCVKRAVFKNPTYCKEHFIQYVESNVKKTIRQFKLLDKNDKVIVAVSGGKDSITCLYILSKWYEVEALAIDEGIKGYREYTIKDLDRFCKERKIKLNIFSIKDEFSFSLDSYMKKTTEKPCTVCGAIRRWMINTHARKLKATKLATGHNLDDEAQSILMNFFRNQLNISARLGPMTGLTTDKRFIPRVKPLYFLTEKETTAYSLLQGFVISYVECPYTSKSYRSTVQKLLNEYESMHPGTKRNIINSFLKMLPGLKRRFRTDKKPNHCKGCGEPAMQEYCKVCQLRQQG